MDGVDDLPQFSDIDNLEKYSAAPMVSSTMQIETPEEDRGDHPVDARSVDIFLVSDVKVCKTDDKWEKYRVSQFLKRRRDFWDTLNMTGWRYTLRQILFVCLFNRSVRADSRMGPDAEWTNSSKSPSQA